MEDALGMAVHPCPQKSAGLCDLCGGSRQPLPPLRALFVGGQAHAAGPAADVHPAAAAFVFFHAHHLSLSDCRPDPAPGTDPLRDRSDRPEKTSPRDRGGVLGVLPSRRGISML